MPTVTLAREPGVRARTVPTIDVRSPIRLLRWAIRSRRRDVVIAALCTISHQACEAAVPVAIGIVIDQAIETRDGTAMLWSVLGLAALFALLSYSFRFGARRLRRAELRVAHDLRQAIVQRVLAPAGMRRGRSGELLSTASSDAERSAYVVDAVWLITGALAALTFGAIALLRVSILLGLLVVVGLIPLLVVVQLLGRPLMRRSSTEQAAAAHAAGVAADLVQGLRVLKGIGAESAGVGRYRRASGESRDAAIRARTSRSAYTAAITLLTGLFLAVVALVAGRLALDETISVGEFVSAVGLSQFLLGPFMRFAMVGTLTAQAMASARRVIDVVDAASLVTGGELTMTGQVRGELVLRDVAAGKLRGLHLEVAAGELVGVVTPDMATARTLLDVLAREADPEHGQVFLDGRNVTELRLDEVRRQVLVTPHDADLFTGSVVENIGTGPGTTPAVLAADVDQVAATLPEGLDTPVTGRGRSLSGGQRQRVALARALAVDAPVLVLHDPTTAVDAATEARIADGVRSIRSGRTTILVTTSPALLAQTDRVVVLADGVAAEHGRHDELVGSSARYRDLVLA